MLEPQIELNHLIESLANDALRALMYEVSVNPKPGLVDPLTSGPHADMDVFTFIDSSVALREYLQSAAELGVNLTGELPELFGRLRELGMHAETAMNQATDGVNTHKGAIFSLGILVAATGYQLINGGDVQQIVQSMLAGLVENDFADVHLKAAADLTAGERQYLQFGYTGIRGEAAAGFPTVFEHGLPWLRQAAGTRNQKLLDTFFNLVAHNCDSNLLKRSGNDLAVLEETRLQAQTILDAGSSRTEAGMRLIERMNTDFERRNLSLGGSADLLILTIFLGLREQLLNFQ